jgi:hypothetical protein
MATAAASERQNLERGRAAIAMGLGPSVGAEGIGMGGLTAAMVSRGVAGRWSPLGARTDLQPFEGEAGGGVGFGQRAMDVAGFGLAFFAPLANAARNLLRTSDNQRAGAR